MSFNAMAWASGCKTGSSTRKLILLLLADRANKEGSCYPSLKTIAADCELGRSTVISQIKVLEADGFLNIEKRHASNGWDRNIYHLDIYGKTSGGSPSAGLGVVREMDQGSPGDGLGWSSSETRGGPGAGLEPVIKPIREPVTKPKANNQPQNVAKATEDEASPAKNRESEDSKPNTSSKEPALEKTNVPPDQSPAAELFDVYNTLGLAKARKLTASRRSHINARIKEYSADEVRFVFSKAQKSRFLTGNNDRKWRADLDWLVNPTNFTKVLEGKYDDRSESQEAKILKEFDL